MKPQKIKEFIPPGLVGGALVYTAVVVAISDKMLTLQHWIGYALFTIIALTYLVNERLANVSFGITLLLGLLNIAAFNPTVTIVGVGLTLSVGKLQLLLGSNFFHWLYALSLPISIAVRL